MAGEGLPAGIRRQKDCTYLSVPLQPWPRGFDYIAFGEFCCCLPTFPDPRGGRS